MGASEAVALAHLPLSRVLSGRVMGLALVIAAVVGFLAHMIIDVPIMAPVLSRGEVNDFWYAALFAALMVACGVYVIVREVRTARRLSAAGEAVHPEWAVHTHHVVPRSLTFQRVPGWALAAAAAASAIGVAIVSITGAPLWNGGLAFLVPWMPVIAVEAQWKYSRYGIFAAFALLVLLQVLHMGEHAMQVGQLAASDGDLASSHGVFGQLDFELVHFVTDTTLWFALGMLLILYRGKNAWLWIAFIAASLHQVEHFYLFFLYYFHEPFYSAGGFAGIMGENGLIGSPLDRPYLHFSYNFIIVVPMVIALWDEARQVDRGRDRSRSAT
jgi:hypothetical protein